MAKTWYYGVFGEGNGSALEDGLLDLSNRLPAVKGSDRIYKEITGMEQADLAISRADFPNWESELIPGRSLIAAIDGENVLFAGYLNKIQSNLNGSLIITVNSLWHYVQQHQVNPTANTLIADPSASRVFRSTKGYSGLASEIVRACFTPSEEPDVPQPPNVLGDIRVNIDWDTKNVSYESLYTNKETFGSILQRITAELSDYGVEVRYVPHLKKGDSVRIVWDVLIGGDKEEHAHLNEQTVINIDLDMASAIHRTSSFSVTHSVEKIKNRIIGQSKRGNATELTGADITTLVSSTTGLPRFDASFSSTIEMEQEQLEKHLRERLSNVSRFSEAFYTVQEDWAADWQQRLGSQLQFGFTEGGAEFALAVRCVSLEFNLSDGSVVVGVTVLLPRYAYSPRAGEDKTEEPLDPVPAPNEGGGLPPNVRPETSELFEGWNAWGRGGEGQLGTGVLADAEKWTKLARGETPNGEHFVDIFPAQGEGQWAHGITESGEVFAWGSNTHGQLGIDGVVGLEFAPVPYRAELFQRPMKQICSLNGNWWQNGYGLTFLTSFGLSSDGKHVESFGYGWELDTSIWSSLERPLKKIALIEQPRQYNNGYYLYYWPSITLIGLDEGGRLWLQNGESNELIPVTDYNGIPLENVIDITSGSADDRGASFIMGRILPSRALVATSDGLRCFLPTPATAVAGSWDAVTLEIFQMSGITRVEGDEFLAAGILYSIMRESSGEKVRVHGIAKGGIQIADWSRELYLEADGTLWKATQRVDGIVVGFTKYTTTSKASKVASNKDSFYALKR